MKSSLTKFALAGVIALHFILSIAYSFILPWGGDEWYTYNGFTIMALPFQLMINLLKAVFGDVNVNNYIIYRQIGTFFTFFLFAALAIACFKDKPRRNFHLTAIWILSFNSFIFFQEQMFRYYGLYLLFTFIYFYFEWIYLKAYGQKRWLFYVLLFISPFLHFFLGWQLFFYIVFQEYNALKTKKELRRMLITLALIAILGLGFFWKKIMAFILPMAFGEMVATGMELRGLSLGLVLKIPLAVFQFFFGYDLAPTEHILVPPIFIGIILFLIIGYIKLLKQSKDTFLFVTLAGLIPFLLMYLVLESLTLPGSTQFESKHALFFLPFLLLLLTQFLFANKRNQMIGSLFIALSLAIGVYYSFFKPPHANWRKLAHITSSASISLVDGRAQQSYTFYATNPAQRHISLWDTAQVRLSTEEFDQVALVLNDYKSFDVFTKDQIWNTGVSSAPRNQVLLQALQNIQANNFKLVNSYVSYPTMGYLFKKSESPLNEKIPNPYDIAYKDLSLPLAISSDTILGWQKKSIGDTILISKPFYYFIQKKNTDTNSFIKLWQNNANQPKRLALAEEENDFRKIYTRSIEQHETVAYQWRKRPLLSSSFAYPGSFWPGEGFIYQFTPTYKNSILLIEDKETVLFLGIQK